jgi:hypothetical protein
MKTIKSFLFVMFMLLASNAMANQVLGEVNESEPVEGAVTGSETLMIYLSNFYETPGHKEAVAQWCSLELFPIFIRFQQVITRMSGHLRLEVVLLLVICGLRMHAEAT